MRLSVLFMLFGLCAPSPASSAADVPAPSLPNLSSQPASQPAPRPNDTLEASLRALSDPELPADELQRAARTVLEAAPASPAALQAATEAIHRAAAPGREVLRALAAGSSAPAALWDPIARRWPAASPEEKILLIGASATIRTPDAAFALISATAEIEPPAVRDAAFAALVRMTGRDDLARDRRAWRAWYLDSIGMSRRQWQERLIASQTARADALRRDTRRLEQQLAAVYRRLWSLTPADARDALLVELLGIDSDPVRSAAMELIRTEIAEGRPIGPGATAAASQLLGHPRGSVRAEAATLIKQIAPDDAGGMVLAALVSETDRHAAAALLSAISRWPSAEAESPILRWLGAEEPIPVAADAALAHLRAGFFASPESRGILLSLLRDQSLADLDVASLRLLVELGEDADRQRIATLLGSESVDQRVAAASALAERPEFVAPLAAAAANDARLFDWAVRAVRQHAVGVEGILRIAAIESVPAEQVRRSVVTLATPLDLEGILQLAEGLGERPAIREAVLTLVTAPERVPSEGSTDRYAEGLLQLAAARLDLGLAEAAIEALNRLPETLPEPLAARRDELLARALLGIGDVAGARALTPPLAVWIEHLARLLNTDPAEQASDQPLRLALEIVDADYPQDRSSADLEVIQAARQRLAPPPEPTPEASADTPGDPAAEPADQPASDPSPTAPPAEPPAELLANPADPPPSRA